MDKGFGGTWCGWSHHLPKRNAAVGDKGDNKRCSLGTMPGCCEDSASAAVDRTVFSSMSPPQEVPSGLWQVPLPTNTPRTATSD